MISSTADRADPRWRIVYLQSGHAGLSDDTSELALQAPALMWQPLALPNRLRVQAGSVGAFLQLGDQSLSNAIGRKPEAAEIRTMVDTTVALSLQDAGELAEDIGRAFEMIFREARSEEPGAETIVEAQLRVLLLILWRRATQASDVGGAKARPAQLLQRFRHLLEVHFAARLSVSEYAARLGTSPDRLHDVCTKVLGKTPLRLIHERTLYEARVLLKRSNRTVDQIAAHLGFKSASQFSKFFKSLTGLPPGLYRAQTAEKAALGDYGARVGFADWP